jgi:type II secretory ATPase GspE/PulE/Tfp pilus assembly ATPase PilB-like protein
MVPPLSDRTGSRSGRAGVQSPQRLAHDPSMLVDRDQAFQLIDRVLPFEACLYYQVLPLAIEGSRLRLGMVNLADAAALDYVRRILAYLHCSLVPQTISSDVHYSTLSAYLNFTGKAQQANAGSDQFSSSLPEVQMAGPQTTEPQGIEGQVAGSEPLVDDRLPSGPMPEVMVQHATPEIQKAKSQRSSAQDSRPTLLLDRSDLVDSDSTAAAQSQASTVAANQLDPAATTTVIQSFETLLPPQLPPPGSALPRLELAIAHADSPVEQLASLPPDQMLQEVLGRVLDSGIGRLYFERNTAGGKILWSKDGVLTSVLDHLLPETMQALIAALKQLAHLDPATTETAQQVEVERLYQKDRLLLRLRFMTNEHGEEATFQVLRGPALKFYQQQQLLHLSRNALGVARNLYQKVSELRDRTHEPVPSEQMLVIAEIDRVMHKINQQLTDLSGRPMASEGPEFR